MFSLTEIKELAKICIEKNIPLFVDEVYSRMTYEKPHIHIASLEGMAELTFTADSISKRFGDPGDRTGWLIAPTKKDAEQLVPIHDKTVVGAPHRIQDPVGITLLMASGMSFSQAIRLGSYELEDFEAANPQIPSDYYKAVNEGCINRARMLLEALRECGYDGIEEPEGSYYLWPRLPKDCRVPTAVDLYETARWHMEDVGVAVVPGVVFGPNDSNSDWGNRIRLSAGRADKVVKKAAENLGKYWKC